MSGLGAGCASSEPTVHVFVAASLEDAVSEVARGWTDARVVVHADASSRLVRQVEQGAPADIVVTADWAWMKALGAERDFEAEAVLARNRLAVISNVPMTDWREVAGVWRLAMAGEVVPLGRYSRSALERGGVVVSGQVVEATQARDVVRWVRAGEADAGMVYLSDAVGMASVLVPSELHDPIEYPAALLTKTPEAAAFFEALRAAQSTYARHGLVGDVGVARSILVDEAGTWGPVWLGALVSLLALLFSAPFAVAGGWWLARADFKGKWLVSTVFLAPLVLPPVVTGYLLLFVFGRNGFLGRVLAELGVSLSFSTAGAVLAAAVVGFPLFVLASKNAFESVEPTYLELAQTLGMSRGQVFLRVALPLAFPGVLAGAVLSFGRGLGEFGATVVFAGNMEGVTRTIPLAVYSALEQPGGEAQAWGLAGASVLMSLVCVAGWEAMNAWQRRRMEWHRD